MRIVDVLKADKRKKHQVECMLKFFAEPRRSNSSQTRQVALEELGSTQIINFLHAYAQYGNAVDYLIEYYRRFKSASQEITVEDVDEVKRLLQIHNVLSS